MSEAFLANWPYLAWAITVATGFYLATSFAVSHMHRDKRAALALWLEGSYESTWSTQFCDMFDGIFGENHLHPRCMALSAVASVLAVFGLWLLLDQILGLISLRADTGLSLTQALLLGAAINIVPDYISLYETRWLLKQFERVRNPFGQLAILIVDLGVTGLIIFAGIQGYLWITGAEPISVVAMMALFSIYAVFFYSTFLTSIWAWAYCLSSWLSRLTAHRRDWLNIDETPGRTLALFVAGFVLIASLAAKPLLTMDADGRIAVDDMLCSAFPEAACLHVARLTKDEEQKLVYLGKACEGGVTAECFGTAFSLYKVKPEEAVKLWAISCERGNATGCTNLGFMYENALGVDEDLGRAVTLYTQGCDGGDARGCTNLGIMYQNALGVDQDLGRAVTLYTQGCDGGDALGCTNLGFMYEKALGVDEDLGRAVTLYTQGCDGGSAGGCRNLGWMSEKALGVAQDLRAAEAWYIQGCEMGDTWACRRKWIFSGVAE